MAINLLNTATVHVGPRLDNTYSTRYTVNPYPVDNTVCFADTLICWIVIFPVDSIMERYLGQHELGKFRENTTIKGHPQLHLK